MGGVRILSGEDVKNGFVMATHTPEDENNYLGNMFVVTVFEENTTVEIYNSNTSKTKLYNCTILLSTKLTINFACRIKGFLSKQVQLCPLSFTKVLFNERSLALDNA